MATIPIGADRAIAAVRAVRRSYRVLRDLPMVPMLILGVLASVAVLAPVIAPHSKLDPVKPTREQCQAKFGAPDCPYVDNAPPFWSPGGTLDTPLGTDFLGRDVLSRLLYGARISLIVALTGTLFAGAIGTVLGVLAGYMGRWWDEIIMRITDAWLTLPSLVFAILLSTVRGPGLWNVVLILALVFWSRYSRAVRGEVLTLRERDFVKLAEIHGIGKITIIWRHLIPNLMNIVMVLFSLQGGAERAASPSSPLFAGPLPKLDIKDAQIAAGRGTPKGALNVGLHFGIHPGGFDPLGYYGPAHHFYYLVLDAPIKPMPQGEFTY